MAAGPSAREDHTWTVDGDGGRAYLFGGRADGLASDALWAYDLAADTWEPITPGGPGPAARWGHTGTWVPGTGLVIWSGQSQDGFFDDIWAYDPATNAWRQLPSGGAVPVARYGSCASLGPDGRLWISHGFTDDGGRFSDTRAYDFATGEWTDLTPAGDAPVERCLHDCFWSAEGKLVLYGGQTTGTPALGDIWAYDLVSATWAQASQPAAPARQLYALASAGEGALVFGGGSVDRGYLGDMWQIGSDLALSQVEIAGLLPQARSGATLIHDPARGRYLLFGGQDESGQLGDLWELNGFFPR